MKIRCSLCKQTIVCIFLILSWGPGCTSHWRQSRVFYTNHQTLRATCEQILQQYGYANTNQKDKQLLQSDWKIFLHPTRPGGHRQSVVLKIFKRKNFNTAGQTSDKNNTTKASNAKSNSTFHYQIKIKVKREVNTSVHDYPHPLHAVWIADGYDTKTENTLLEAIEALLELKTKPSLKSIKKLSKEEPRKENWQ